MKKQRKINVKWVGPDGSIDQTNDRDLLRLLDHKLIIKEFGRKNVKEIRKIIKKALKYLRELFRTYELVSPYHNVGHNFVTAITTLKAFIGGLKKGYKFTKGDLQVLLVATLFHDTGYLRKSKDQEKTNVFNHSIKSLDFVRTFMEEVLDWNGGNIPKVYELQRFTIYSGWQKNKKNLKKNKLGQILVGSDFMQVVDKNYFRNLKVLSELIHSKSIDHDKKGQRKFFYLSEDVVSHVWPFLDSYYGSEKKNPYRKSWDNFEKIMEKLYM